MTLELCSTLPVLILFNLQLVFNIYAVGGAAGLGRGGVWGTGRGVAWRGVARRGIEGVTLELCSTLLVLILFALQLVFNIYAAGGATGTGWGTGRGVGRAGRAIEVVTLELCST